MSSELYPWKHPGGSGPKATQQILADPGRELTSVGKVPCFFKIVVSYDVQLWMSPELLLFRLFKMENLVVFIPGEFYIFATFFSLYLHFPHTHWPGSGCLGRGHALLILGGENVIKHKTLTLSDSKYYSFISCNLEGRNLGIEVASG